MGLQLAGTYSNLIGKELINQSLKALFNDDIIHEGSNYKNFQPEG